MSDYTSLLLRIAVALETIAKNSKPPRRNPLEHQLPQVYPPYGPPHYGGVTVSNSGFVDSQPLDGGGQLR